MADEAKSQRSRPRLGRGLASLISSPSALPADTDQEYQHVTGLPPVPAAAQRAAQQAPADGSPLAIAVDKICPNPFQPRKAFATQDLAELTESIRQQGILQPLIVAPAGRDNPSAYVLVAGERRLRAARQAGFASVPCIVRPANQQQLLEWALIENIQRADLNPIEKAGAFRDYIDRFHLSHTEAAQRLGQPRATVTNYLRILELEATAQGLIASGKLSFGHAKVLAGMAGQPERQGQLARKAAQGDLSVRQLEELIASGWPGQAVGARASAKATPSKPPYMRDIEERLGRVVGTRVAILPGRAKNTGRMVIDYYSLDDFDRIARLLGLAAAGD